MDTFGLVDYLKPVSATNDYRTSTYRGHRHLDYQTNVPRIRCPVGPLQHSEVPCTEFTGKSEQQEQFHWKPVVGHPLRTPFHKNVKYMRTFDTTHFHHPTNPPKIPYTTYTDNFNIKSQPFEETIPIYQIPPIDDLPTKRYSTNRATQNYGKLLDLSATTCNLAYPPYTKKDLQLSSTDNISFWNWDMRRRDIFKVRQTFCDPFKGKRYNEHRCTVKHVPNYGLTSTVKSDYTEVLDALDFDITHIRNNITTFPGLPLEMKTENAIYGSGKRIQNYIDTGRPIF